MYTVQIERIMALQLQQQVNMLMSLSTGMAWRLFYALIVSKIIAAFRAVVGISYSK